MGASANGRWIGAVGDTPGAGSAYPHLLMLLLLHTPYGDSHPPTAGGTMPQIDSSKVSRWDLHGREHTVHVHRTGVQRTIRCDTCGWRRSAQFLPWLKAQEHLEQAHQATVDPSAA
ncbi:hypothetical protein SUDANB23_04158 [Streptomyces sp. enrichment culture]